jgi:hypothetical protein
MVTYYSDIKSLKDIHNPLMDNSTLMRHTGFFDVVKNDATPYFGTSLKKTLHNQGRIFCDDASQLFNITSGYLSLTIALSENIHDGILSRAKNNDYMIWGVNMGESDIHPSGIGAFFTKDGIEFRVATSNGSYSLTDSTTTIVASKFFEIEFLWDINGISIVDESPTMLIRVNNKIVIGGVIPISNDLDVNSDFYSGIGQDEPTGSNVFSDIQFQLFDNVHKLNNLPCSISRIITEDSIPEYFTGS